MIKNKYFKFKLCPNGYHYLYFGNDLYITSKGDYVILEQSGDIVEFLDMLYSENQKLKQLQASTLRELRIYRKIASCSNCKYQNYDWFDDGDEFEICEKGNNDQQTEYRICKEWEEFE